MLKGPLSLHTRVALAAALSGLIVLLATGSLFQFWLSRVVSENLNGRMDAQVMAIAQAIKPDGKLALGQLQLMPEVGQKNSAWSWLVITPQGRWRGGQRIVHAELFPGLNQFRHGIFSAHGRTARGGALHMRLWAHSGPSGLDAVFVGAPDSELAGPETQAVKMIVGSLVLLSALLAVSTLWQLRFGLSPLRRLSQTLAAVRRGEVAQIPHDVPRELRPLVEEIDSLVEQNQLRLQHTRHHVANLAHGLKTPLATLALRLAREGASDETRLLVTQLDKRIAHHLRRARGAAISSDRARTDLSEVVEDLIFAMRQMYAERDLDVDMAVPEKTIVAVDREDLDEMLGNAVDNACRHARRCVRISAAREGQWHLVRIADDGPGVAEGDLAKVLDAGIRLDESEPGYGFGLAILRELVGLYGGNLALDRSEMGGLEVCIRLPASHEGVTK